MAADALIAALTARCEKLERERDAYANAASDCHMWQLRAEQAERERAAARVNLDLAKRDMREGADAFYAQERKLEQAEAEARDWKNAAESENVMRKQAEAEVALRDRMLRDIIERIALTPERWNGWTTEEVLADLRARAEKEAER